MEDIATAICVESIENSSLIYLVNGNKASVSLSLRPEINQVIFEFLSKYVQFE